MSTCLGTISVNTNMLVYINNITTFLESYFAVVQDEVNKEKV